MSSLQNQKIKNTYPGLIKTEDNSALGSTASRLTDGLGNTIPMTISGSSVVFDGDVDITQATIVGGSFGTSGTSGVSGLNGSSGSSGVSGTSGLDGTSGSSGVSGGSVGFSSAINGSSITGTTNETISRSVLIPANTFSAGDWIELREFSQKSGTSNTATTRVYLNTVNSLLNAIIISTIFIAPASAVSMNTIRNLLVKTSDGSGSGTLVINPTTSSSNVTDWTQTTTTSNTLTARSIDWTQDQYLIFTGQLSNSGDTLFNSGYVFRKI